MIRWLTNRPAQYTLSLPERTLRVSAALGGGLINEITELLLPTWVRQSHLYQATVARLLRVIIELVGGVEGVFPADGVSGRELVVRKTVGNAFEAASFLVVGWSPLWLLAAAADLTGGTRVYLQALVNELKTRGALPAETHIQSVDDLLSALEGTSGTMADAVDLPPLNVNDMRASFESLRRNVGSLPNPAQLAETFALLQQVGAKEGRSLLSVSSVLGASAVRAGTQLGSTYLFDYYRTTLRDVLRTGLLTSFQQASSPYFRSAIGHLNPRRSTWTGRILDRFARKRTTSAARPS